MSASDEIRTRHSPIVGMTWAELRRHLLAEHLLDQNEVPDFFDVRIRRWLAEVLHEEIHKAEVPDEATTTTAKEGE